MDNMNEKEGTILPQPERSSRNLGSRENESNRAASKTEESAAPSAEKGGTLPSASAQSAAATADEGAGDSHAPDPAKASASPVSTISDMPMIADDSDLIEKEWVSKAKQIVDQTKDDPYNQNKQILRLRADYLKKRYNKDVKTQED